ncbi:MAG: hypothetical protein KatS3mg108_1446 [Isosphaeraceae bacterium]|jgi:hypothetical protein|nr:MAG: hypothetical protein KatS3mg108_1446 [Isosphaeraceae bacterium]
MNWPEPDASESDPLVSLAAVWFTFGLAALALGAQTADLLLHLFALITADQGLVSTLTRPEYAWAVGTSITWGAALASYGLIGLSPSGPSRVRATVLASMNTFDVFLWLADHAAELSLSLPLDLLRDPWVAQAVRILQWFEPLLFAHLAAERLQVLGSDSPRAALVGVQSSAWLGLLVWGISFALRTGWMFGWLQPRRRLVAEIQLLALFALVLLTITVFQTTVLCGRAAREAARQLRARRLAEADHELLRPPPDPFAEDDRNRRDRDPFAS